MDFRRDRAKFGIFESSLDDAKVSRAGTVMLGRTWWILACSNYVGSCKGTRFMGVKGGRLRCSKWASRTRLRQLREKESSSKMKGIGPSGGSSTSKQSRSQKSSSRSRSITQQEL